MHHRIEVERAAGFGVELRGVDLSRPVDESGRAQLRQALLDHQVIVLRDQFIHPAEQLEFAQIFGRVVTYPSAESIPDFPGVGAVVKQPHARFNFGGSWHIDGAFLEIPPKVTVLRAVELPPRGGGTVFADMYAALERLPASLIEGLEGRQGVFSAAAHTRDPETLGRAARRDEAAAVPEVLHPLIRRHPETGRRSLYISPPHIHGIAGMAEDEGRVLLEHVIEFALADAPKLRLDWAPGTVVAYDNRCLMHYAINDYPGHRRELHRIIVADDQRPRG